MLTVEPIPAFNDNYIWLLYDTDSRRAFVVDPGDAAPVMAVLSEQKLTLSGILITHHHFDHVGGLAELRAAYEPVVYGPHNPAIDGIDHRLGAGDRIEVLGRTFSVMTVPGHTLDHIASYHESKQPLLFCGDTLFAGGCGRLFEGTPPMMLASLESLAALPGNTLVYCAHEYTLANLAFARAVEPENSALQERIAQAELTRANNTPTVPSSLSLELETNPFLRCAEQNLLDSLASQGKLTADNTADVFALVRAWKDNF